MMYSSIRREYKECIQTHSNLVDPIYLKALRGTNSVEIYLIKTDDDRPYPVVAIPRCFVLFQAERLVAGSVIGG